MSVRIMYENGADYLQGLPFLACSVARLQSLTESEAAVLDRHDIHLSDLPHWVALKSSGPRTILEYGLYGACTE